jgi:hypothetical protein
MAATRNEVPTTTFNIQISLMQKPLFYLCYFFPSEESHDVEFKKRRVLSLKKKKGKSTTYMIMMLHINNLY